MRAFWNRLDIAWKTFITVLTLFIMVEIAAIYAIWHFESDILIEKERHLLQRELQTQSEQIEAHMTSLAKETRFLASLEVMDDLIGKDIDKRIATLLRRRADDLGEGIILVARADGAFVAASKAGFVEAMSARKRQRLSRQYLYFYAPVYASFDRTKKIGSVSMLYPLKNLASLHAGSPDKTLWITPPVPHPLFVHKRPVESIVATQKLDGILKGWTIHLAYDKKRALMTLRHVQTILFYTFLIALFLLAGVMLILSRKLTHPLKELTKTVQEITRTGDYTKRVAVTSEDEIGILSKSFNRLISQTGSLIEEIRRQERLHHDQLIKLIAFFNALIETKTQQETIDTALTHIKSLFALRNISFAGRRPDTPHSTVIPVSYYNYKNRRETDAGYIVIAPEEGHHLRPDLLSPISKMLRLQLEHIHLLADTKEALEAKSTFLSTMSHELRTPLGSILNLTQHLTLMPGIDEEARRMLGAIETSAQHLLAMINNILQLSKLESNSIVVHKEPVDLTELMHEIFEITEPLITDKEIALIKDIACEGVTIQTDANLLKQVIINLLSNAIKFTEKGTIEVSLRRHGDHYRFSVRDTGIGIAKSRQKHLFQLFYQAHSDTEKIPDSSGLGLALSQKVAALLGGKITIRSEGIGHGTTAIFTFTSF